MTPKVENSQNCYNSVLFCFKEMVHFTESHLNFTCFVSDEKNSIKSNQIGKTFVKSGHSCRYRSEYFVFLSNNLCCLVGAYIKMLLKSSPDLRSIGCLVVHGVVVFSLLSTRWWVHVVSHAGVQEPVLLRFLDLEYYSMLLAIVSIKHILI